MVKKQTRVAMAVAFALLAVPAWLLAHNPGNPFSDFELGTDEEGGLVAVYPLDTAPVVAISDTGFAGLWSGTFPGFVPAATSNVDAVNALGLGEGLGLELLYADPGLQYRINATTLSLPGDMALLGIHDDPERSSSSLHQHGEYQFFVDGSAPRAFAEARLAMRVVDVSEDLEPSTPLSLLVSNGYLPAPSEASTATNKCLKRLTKEVGRFLATSYATLARCLATADAVVNLGSSASRASRTCSVDRELSSGMTGRILNARSKARARIDASCGPLSASSLPFTDGAIDAHLDMARCRAEELVAAAYNNARDLVTDAIEAAEAGSACVGEVCVGGIAHGDGCTRDLDCATKTLVTEATVCLHETSQPE